MPKLFSNINFKKSLKKISPLSVVQNNENIDYNYGSSVSKRLPTSKVPLEQLVMKSQTWQTWSDSIFLSSWACQDKLYGAGSSGHS